MRTTILTGMTLVALLATSSVAAQTGPPQVTETVTGPTYIAPGGQATLDVSVDVAGAEADLYITWVVAENGDSCCDLVSSTLVSGRANALPAQYGSQRWTVFGPHADIRVTLALRDAITSGQIIVGGYLPGTDVSRYLTVNGWKMIVGAPLPGAGGPPGGTRSSTPYLFGGGVAMLALAATCFAGLKRKGAGYHQ
jgi:hypothetical protein